MSSTSAAGQSSNFSKLLGMTIDKAENGESQVRMSMQEQLLNLHGRMHGGALFSLIDTAKARSSATPACSTPGARCTCWKPRCCKVTS